MPRARNRKISALSGKFGAGTAIVFILLTAAAFADFLAPYDYRHQSRQSPTAPPTAIRFRDEQGNLHFRPFIYKTRLIDPLTKQYSDDLSRIYPIVFFTRADTYKFWGLFSSNLHLFGVADTLGAETPRITLLGSDALGRDRFSRLLHAIRFSLLVSPIGVFLACLIGISIGVISGYSDRLADTMLMGSADAMLALPAMILILAGRAAFPLELPPSRVAVLLIFIFALTGWAEMARLSRGLVRSMREREFVLSAKAVGLTQPRILTRHIFPNIARPLLTQATLMLPVFLIAEVSLSYLGVGLQAPEPSLGNMLAAAGDLTQLQSQPFILLAPAAIIFMFVLGARLLADGFQRRPDSFNPQL
jgi:peptide/nickel transport system permease protein